MWWGSYGRVLESAEGGMVVLLKGLFWLLDFCCRMTSADHNDLMPAQEKLEWVTPKISLMGAGETDGSGKNVLVVETKFNFQGPS